MNASDGKRSCERYFQSQLVTSSGADGIPPTDSNEIDGRVFLVEQK